MKKKPIYTLQVPSVTEHFAKTVDAAFPKKFITVGMSLEEIMENSGQRQVVEYVLRAAVGKSGNVNRQT